MELRTWNPWLPRMKGLSHVGIWHRDSNGDVSHICADLDDEVAAFGTHPWPPGHPRRSHIAIPGQPSGVSQVVVIATAVSAGIAL